MRVDRGQPDGVLALDQRDTCAAFTAYCLQRILLRDEVQGLLGGIAELLTASRENPMTRVSTPGARGRATSFTQVAASLRAEGIDEVVDDGTDLVGRAADGLRRDPLAEQLPILGVDRRVVVEGKDPTITVVRDACALARGEGVRVAQRPEYAGVRGEHVDAAVLGGEDRHPSPGVRRTPRAPRARL